AVSPAEVLIPVESRLAFAECVHGSVTRPNDSQMIGAGVAAQTVRDVVPELREQTHAARGALCLAGARAVRTQAASRRTPITQQLLSGHRIRAAVSVFIIGSRESGHKQ
ncbi:hypothetical protein M9458_039106, partial [Cirrhinus mrigala]